MVDHVIITAGGEGSRMKCLSPEPKYRLHYNGKPIIECINDCFKKDSWVRILTKQTPSRLATLKTLSGFQNVLIIDCDIIPHRATELLRLYKQYIHRNPIGAIFYFHSTKDKYGSIDVQMNNGDIQDMTVCAAVEGRPDRNMSCKCSGAYFVKDINTLLVKMESGNHNSIAEAMIGAQAIHERSFIRMGDPADYYEALGIKGGSFTGNRILMNENTVIKYCRTGQQEAEWYKMAQDVFNTPKVHFADSEMIITERIYPTEKATAEDFIRIIGTLRQTPDPAIPIPTYFENLPKTDFELKLESHRGSFFHGDLSTHNVLKNSRLYLIDPNYKGVFGSWLTDAGKAFFSFVAFEQNYPEAKKIADHFGSSVINYAVAEGLRVCKYKHEYKDIVNNIFALIR